MDDALLKTIKNTHGFELNTINDVSNKVIPYYEWIESIINNSVVFK